MRIHGLLQQGKMGKVHGGHLTVAPKLLSLLIVVALVRSVPCSADEPAEASPPHLTLPKIASRQGIHYPDAARVRGLEGKVLIAFDITPEGRPTNGALIDSDDDLFTKAATEYLANLRFEVPHGDTVPGSSFVGRYRIGFVFCLPPSSLDDTFAVPAVPIVISGFRIPGSPIKHPPPPGASGQCSKVR